ncbi:MAG: hypothetical protein A4E73_01248 [Syntrophaceae bacterium PtaU1.Bin231]|nr:MAG: hypothetical protein A4E73_01248 [Syntrophaceae bacterium PtaU1.Bin231]
MVSLPNHRGALHPGIFEPPGAEQSNRNMEAVNFMEANIEPLKKILKNCTLCPRRCRVDRTRGEKGFCGLDDRLRVDRALAHHGEEPPLSGSRGAGTIFFSSCNLRCSYCQNHQISHRAGGGLLDAEGLVRIMLRPEGV